MLKDTAPTPESGGAFDVAPPQSIQPVEEEKQRSQDQQQSGRDDEIEEAFDAVKRVHPDEPQYRLITPESPPAYSSGRKSLLQLLDEGGIDAAVGVSVSFDGRHEFQRPST